MGLSQTSVQDQKAVQLGSVAAFFSTDSGSSFTNLGVGTAFAYTEEITPLDAEPDNGVAPERADGVASQKITFTGELWENNLAKIQALRGGIDIISSVASAEVAGASQVQASGDWAYDVAFALDGQMSDGTAPTVTSVTGGTDGLLVVRDDYTIEKSATTGLWGISITDSATVTTLDQTMTVVTTYTPAASTKVTTGGLTAASRVWIRLYNRTPTTADATDAAANAGITAGDAIFDTVRYDLYYAIVNAGDAVTFPSKDDANPVIKYAVSMEGENDPSRTVGDQLMAKEEYLELQSSVTL